MSAKPANENPWYCLATLHGEAADVAERNRKSWNEWTVRALTTKERGELLVKGFPENDIPTYFRQDLLPSFIARTGNPNASLPDPLTQISFEGISFENDIDFSGYLFAGSVIFDSASFKGRADFDSAVFLQRASFDSASFEKRTSFKSTRFCGDAYFGKASFAEYTSFDSASFEKEAIFNYAYFAILADYRAAHFAAEASFHKTRFERQTTFRDTQFDAITLFSAADFKVRVPDFRGAKLHEATEWHGAHWPPPPKDVDEAQAQIYAYERLKQEMDRLKKHDDEQNFFRKELRARRELNPRSGYGLLNGCYEVFSNYGVSVRRPLAGFLANVLVGALVFSIFPVSDGARLPIAQALWLSLFNALPFLPNRREAISAELADSLCYGAILTGVLQSLFSTALLFLLGLAVRNRFRMK